MTIHTRSGPTVLTPVFITSGGDQLLPLPAVMAMTSMSKSKIYKDIRLGIFPRPLKLGARKSAWRASDVNSWLEAQETRRDV